MGLLLIPKGLNALVMLTHQYQESPLFSASIKKRQKCGLAAKEANSWFDWKKKKSSKRESGKCPRKCPASAPRNHLPHPWLTVRDFSKLRTF